MAGENGRETELEGALITLAIEAWRFSRVFARAVAKLDAGESTRFVSQMRYFQQKLEDAVERAELKVVNVEGQPYDPGLPASALNLGDFEQDDELLVDQMVEPIIMGPNGLRKEGTMLLKKVGP